MSSEDIKRKALAERTVCRRSFNALIKQITNAIEQNNTLELIQGRFFELRDTRKRLKELHSSYIVISINEDDDESLEDEYLDKLEEEYRKTEQHMHEYAADFEKKRDNQLKEDKKTSDKSKRDAEINEEVVSLRNIRSAEAAALESECSRAIILKNKDEASLSAVKSIRHELSKQMEKVNDINTKLLKSLKAEELKKEIDWLVDKRRQYQTAVDALDEVTDKVPAATSTTVVTHQQTSDLQFHKLPMPSFNGNIRDYPRFKKDFNNIVLPRIKSGDPSYTLMSCLKDEPRSIVKCISDDAVAMWARLEEVYGDPSKVIDAIMCELQECDTLQEFDHKRIVSFIDMIEGANADLKRLGVEKEISNAHSVSMIEGKLPRDLRLSWSKYLNEITDERKMMDKFPHLLTFLQSQRRIIEYADSSIRCSLEEERGSVSHVGDGNKKYEGETCIIHNSASHNTENCNKFKYMSATERIETLQQNKACYRCLNGKHFAKMCPKPAVKCGVDGCEKNHHALLHDAHKQGLVFGTSCFSEKSPSVLLQLMRIRCNAPRPDNLTVLWDSAADFCLITFSKVKRLGLTGKPVHLSITKVGGNVDETQSYVYKVPLQDKSGVTHYLDAYGIEQISSEIRRIDIKQITHLFPETNRDEIERPTGFIDVLVGYNYAPLHPKMIANPEGNLVMLQNAFGKCLGGSHKSLHEKTIKQVKNISIHFLSGSSSMLENFNKGEHMGVSCWPQCGGCKCGNCSLGSLNCSIREQRELKQIEENLQHVGDCWETTYPWIKDPNSLIDNRYAAEGILRSTERRLAKDTKLKETFINQMHDLIDRGIARELSDAEIEAYKGPTQYLNVHEVIKKESETTPFRLVFSSRQHMGQILNEFWAKGPDLLNNPLGIILRFREEQYAVIGDIRKMYHSVKLKAGVDQHTHRFLWRDCDTNKKPGVYVLTTVTFGDRPAGTIAAVALKKTAIMGSEQAPLAAKIISENTYVDDIADSFPSEEELKERTEEMSTMLRKGGFIVKEWIFLPTNMDKRNYDMSCTKGEFDSAILGCKLNIKEDTFTFKVKLNFSRKVRKIPQGPDLSSEDIPRNLPVIMTKRQLLEQLSGVWDPQGFASPIITRGKISMRALWKLKLDWDDPIPPEQKKDWEKFFTELFALEKISFPRCLKPVNAVGKPLLIIFCDGSEDAYGAVAYVRWELADGSFACRLLLAKSRIAPTKQISIVRLELNGAVIGARLKSFIYQQMRYDFEGVMFLVDSMIVHAMVKLDSHGFRTYAGLRLGEIHELSNGEDWYWIEGSLNIADWVTRKNTEADDLKEGSMWQEAPDFVKRPIREWPVRQKGNKMVEIPETRGTSKALSKPEAIGGGVMIAQTSKIGIDNILNIEDFSSYNRLRRIVAWIIKAVSKFACADVSNHLTRKELECAEELLIKAAQRELFQKLEQNTFRRLCARVEKDIIIVGGRAERWLEATWNRQTFILLPAKHNLSTLIATEEHERIGHLGVSATSAAVRSKWWIINIHQLAKWIRNNCFDCKKNLHERSAQRMADLPLERLKPCPPFSNVGIDYFGPYTIKGEAQKRIHGKCYGVIIVCMAMRGVYVDITTDYSTDSLLQLLRRFGSRHGWPSKFHSDSGTQLKGAPEELKRIISRLDEKELQQYVSTKNSEWHFIPPDAPWMNGVTESLVKSVKRSLMTAVGTQILSYSELQTVMFECAGLVNERPIGRTPTEPDDGSYLCPNDLILGRSSNKMPQGDFDCSGNLSRRFRFIQSLASAFWRKWTRDFFPSLLIRSKWHVERRNVQVGDMVLLKDANAIRGIWRLGRITRTCPNEDGLVRRVFVLCKTMGDGKKTNENTKNTELERAVHDLIVIVPTNDEGGRGRR